MKEQLYKKVFIKSEDDLPKGNGHCIVHQKSNYIESWPFDDEIYTPEIWMDKIDWYLLPLPSDDKQEEELVVKENLTTQHDDLQYILRTANEIAETFHKEKYIKSIGDFEVRLQELLLTYFPVRKQSPSKESSEQERTEEEVLKPGAILQCHIGFGNDLDGYYKTVIEAMEEYASQFASQSNKVTDKF